MGISIVCSQTLSLFDLDVKIGIFNVCESFNGHFNMILEPFLKKEMNFSLRYFNLTKLNKYEGNLHIMHIT